MSVRALHVANVASAAVMIGGGLIVAMPQHALSIVQLVIATVAGAAGVHALATNVPTGGWLSPFKWLSPFNPSQPTGRRRRHPEETDSIRSKLSGWRQPLDEGPAMPSEVLRVLKPLIATAIEVNPDDERQMAAARDRLSSVPWAILASDPSRRYLIPLPPNPSEVARVVVHVLDEIDRPAAGALDFSRPRMP